MQGIIVLSAVVMLVPEMVNKGFSLEFSTVVTAASSMITPLIPPDIAMILYACIANVSVGKLFVSGIGVGATLCVSMMLLTSVISKKRGYKKLREEPATFERIFQATKTAFLPLCLPVIIIGGIRLGVFTATEAGAVAIVYSVFLGVLYKTLKPDECVTGLKETVTTTASIMLIVSAASVYSWVLTKEQIPQALTGWMIANISNKYVFLIFCNVFLLIVGMFIEGNASMIILVPLLPSHCHCLWYQRYSVRHDVYLQQRHRRAVSPNGNPDVCHLRHYQVQDGGLHQRGGSILHPSGSGPVAVYVFPAFHHVPRQFNLLIHGRFS